MQLLTNAHFAANLQGSNFGIVPRGALSSKSAAIFIVNNKVDFNSNVNILIITDEQIQRDKI